MTKTELRRRIRALARTAKESQGYPINSRTEIGLRTDTYVTLNPPEGSSLAYVDDGDLNQYVTIDEWVKHDGQEGEVVHIYISSNNVWDSGELLDIVMGWIGTIEYEPMLLLRRDQ